MTESQNTKDKRITNGYHYAIVNGDEEIIEKYNGLKYPYCHGNCCENYEYLAPVPSYKQWQTEKEENTKLKELLIECRDEIKFMYDTYGQSFPKPFDDSLLTKINQVLGEE